MHPENELILYYYGELSSKELLAHLDSCAECRDKLEMMKKASACVNESAIEPPQTVLDELKTAARKKAIEIASGVPRADNDIKTFPWRRWAFAGALAAVLAVSLYFTGRQDTGQFAWNDSMEDEIESLDCDLAEFQLSLDSAYAWSGFDLEYSGIESEGASIENSIKWREL